MMFSCCHPRLPEEAQVALVLHILCGFSVDEVAARVRQHARGHRKAHHARQEDPRRLEEALRHRRRAGLRRAPSRRSARALPAFQRGLPRRVARIGRARGALPGGHAPGGAAPRRIRWRRRRRRYALSALMCLHAARLPAALDASGDFARSSIRIARAGMRSSSPKAESCSIFRLPVPSSPSITSRPPSPGSTPPRRRPRRPTGRRSSLSTTG